MFSDPFTAVMALILLAFIGTLAVFLRIWRELDSLRTSIRELKDTIQFDALDVSRQNCELADALRELRTGVSTSARAEDGARETCLGELLERGLPNLTGGAEGAPGSRLTLASSRRQKDDTLNFRPGDGINTDFSLK